MKNRSVPIRLTITLFGLSLLFTAVLATAGNPLTTEQPKSGGTWVETVRANQHTGTVDPADVARAMQQAEELKYKAASAMGLNWMNMGPDNFPGLVWSTIFDKNDPAGLTLVSGSAMGGLWRSVNLGLTWSKVAVTNDFVPKVSSLVQAPNGTIYAATGVATCKTVKYSGGGIYSSNSLGEFTLIAKTVGISDFEGITKLAVNAQSGRLYAATIGGLYFSDNGEDWAKILPGYCSDVCVGPDGTVLTSVGDSGYMAPAGDFNAKVNLTSGEANMLPKTGIAWTVFAIAPSDANVMYASFAGFDGKMLGLYVSDNKGASWSLVFPNNPSFEPFGSAGYGCYSHTLTVFPNDPHKLFLGGYNMWYGERVLPTGFYNWEQVSFGNFGQYSPYYVPYYHHAYQFRPQNPNELVMSTDGGVTIATIGAEDVTFQTSNKNMQTGQFTSVAFSSVKGYAMGGGERIGTQALGYFHPSQVNTQSDGYQVYRQDPSGLNANAQPQPGNYGGTGGTCVWSSVDSRVAAYTKFKGDSTANVPFKAIRRQDFTDIYKYNYFTGGLDTISTAHVPMYLWETYDQQKAFGITRDTSRFIAESDSVPAGTTIFIQSGSNRLLFPYTVTTTIPKGDTIYVPDPLAGRFFLYAKQGAATRGIFMSKNFLKFDKLMDYYLIFKDAVNNDEVTAITVSADLNTLWAGTKGGRLIRVTGLLQAYDSATANITSSQCVLTDTIYSATPFTGRTVTSISIHPKNSSLVLVTLGNYGNQDYVYFSQNGNADDASFASIQGNLPKVPVFTGLLEMTTTGNVILGTDLGVFTTTSVNGTSTQWAADMNNVGNVPVTDIRQQTMKDYHIANYGVIYMASFGRGLWMDETYAAPVGIEPVPAPVAQAGEIRISPNPVHDRMNLGFTSEKGGKIEVAIYDMTGRVVMTTILNDQPRGEVNTTINVDGLARGAYLVRAGNSNGKFVKN